MSLEKSNNYEAPKTEENRKAKFEYSPEEYERQRKILAGLIEDIEKDLWFQGVPVGRGKDCRIDMKSFEKIYGKEGEGGVSEDEKYVAEHKKIFAEKREREFKEKFPNRSYRPPKELGGTIGEKLEMLKTVIFHKFLNKRCVIARSSEYDDIKNGIDNLVFDVENGEVICAVDDVGSDYGPRYKRKKSGILEENKRGGGELKYGMTIKRNKKKELEITPAKIKNIPKLYLCLPIVSINKAMGSLTPFLERASDYEKDIFDYFSDSVISQINELKKIENAPPEFKKRLECFKEIFEEKK